MDERVGELWGGYRGAVRALYEGADDRLRLDPDGGPEERLGAVVRESEGLGAALAARLPGNRRESAEDDVDFDPDHETVARAAAAIDVAVAADLFDEFDGEKEQARSEGFTVPPLLEQAASDPRGGPPVRALLEEADGLFPEQARMGSENWPPTAIGKAIEAADQLIDSGAELVVPCGIGLP